jgi:hypothetical protein
MNDKQMHPPDTTGDYRDAELDAMLAVSDDRLLTAIRRNLDLAAGLTQIIGDSDPPRHETSPSADPAGTALLTVSGDALGLSYGHESLVRVQNADDVRCRIASLRFSLLDLRRETGHGPLCDTAAALISGAAANLKELNRGLEAGELTCYDAISLLDQAELALEKAHDSQKPATSTWRASYQLVAEGRIDKRRSWLLRWLVCGPTRSAFLTMAIPMLIAALVAAVLPALVAATFSVGFLTGALVMPVLSGSAFAITLTAGWTIAARTLQRRAAAQAEEERRAAAGAVERRATVHRLQRTRDKLRHIRLDVVRLFDEADQCMP